MYINTTIWKQETKPEKRRKKIISSRFLACIVSSSIFLIIYLVTEASARNHFSYLSKKSCPFVKEKVGPTSLEISLILQCIFFALIS